RNELHAERLYTVLVELVVIPRHIRRGLVGRNLVARGAAAAAQWNAGDRRGRDDAGRGPDHCQVLFYRHAVVVVGPIAVALHEEQIVGVHAGWTADLLEALVDDEQRV